MLIFCSGVAEMLFKQEKSRRFELKANINKHSVHQLKIQQPKFMGVQLKTCMISLKLERYPLYKSEGHQRDKF